MAENRTKKTIRNVAYSVLYKLLEVVLNFILRTIFIRTLSLSFLGISSLFTNVLSVLSLMELGVGSAIVFALYKPLAQGDKEKIASLMMVYKKFYSLIGTLILILGFLFTPFLSYIVKLPEAIDSIQWIYWLYVINSAASYFLAYQRTLLTADQNHYVNTQNQIFFKMSRFVLLSVALLLTKNFIVYLILDIINTIVSNIHIRYVVQKRYAYLKEIEPKPLEPEEKKNILKYVFSGIFSKVGQTVVTSTDNIIISSFISTISVGLYANYNMVFSGVDTLVYLLFNNLTASVGNFAVEKDPDESKKLFEKIFFINYLIIGSITICLFSLLTPFIQIWLGKEFTVSEMTVLVIVLNFYLTGMCNCSGNFLGAIGELYYKNRYRSLIEAITNLSFSILFVKVFHWNLTGVFLGTTICFLLGRVWMDPYTIYTHWFQCDFKGYVWMYLKKSGCILVLSILCKMIAAYVFRTIGIHILSWILVGIICMGIFGCSVFLLYRRQEELLYVVNVLKRLVKKVNV